MDREHNSRDDPNPEAHRSSTIPVSSPAPGSSTGGAWQGRTPLGPGSVVKHYEILRELGQGGMGSVFLAQDLRLARLCAIKSLLAYTGASAGRFLAEARATACCKHENIVTIYEVDEIDGHPFMVLEYLEGQTLRTWMAARECGDPASPGRAIELMTPVVRALVYAHALGIVHRDLKPENIFLTEAGQVKVLDFGVAKRIGVDEDHGLAGQGALVGTRPYMSPEQWLDREITPQSDIWAAGVILHELVTGSHPLAPATVPHLLEVQDLDLPVPSLHERRPDLGPLGAVIDRCLKKHRSERIASARELLAELAQLASDRTAPVRSTPRRYRRTAVLASAGVAAAVALLATDLPRRVSWVGARSRGTAITDVPLPSSPHPEARAAYRAALHGFRDANWAIADDQLRRAVALDPTLAAAHLRLAILRHYTAGRVPEARESYALAVRWRVALSERDRDILAAFEPLFTREPVELVRFAAQLGELARQRPDDAEVLALVAYFGAGGLEVQLRAARHAVEVDPDYADAWQAVGKSLFALGRIDEALHAFDGCLAASPTAVDCLGERARIYAAQGQCAAAEADLRNASAMNPHGRYWRNLWASSLMALGKPVETAIEVLIRKWAAEPDARRELIELHDRASVDLLRGQFAQARASALALQARTRHEVDAELHTRYATLLIDLAIEAGQLADAAQVADDYLRRREAWVSSDINIDDMAMLTVLRDAGRLSADDFEARRTTWLARYRDLATSMPHEAWLAAWVRPATTREAAVATLAAAPSNQLETPVRSLDDHAAIGALLLRAGRSAEAIRFLGRAAYGCDGLLAPAAHLRAAAQLGQALEATGDRAGACDAYQRVLRRWGATTPPSVTARDARLRASRLGCRSSEGTEQAR